MMREDKIVLAKVMFLISRLDMPQVAEAIFTAIGRDIEVSEAVFDQYWILESLEEDGTVTGAITTNSDHERFPELFLSINERIARYVDAIRNAPKPWERNLMVDVCDRERAESEALHERIYLISPQDVFRSKLDAAPSEMAEYLGSTLPWREKFPASFGLTPGDEGTLVKVSFLMAIVEMTPIADFVAEAFGERVELAEPCFDKYWAIESFDKDNDVGDAINAYARHPHFPELRSFVNETIADYIDGVIEKGRLPRRY